MRWPRPQDQPVDDARRSQGQEPCTKAADRDGVSQHEFRGGNAFMLRMLNRYRDELQVTAPAADLERAADLTEAHLRTKTAAFGLLDVRFADGAVVVDVDVRNATGHKLPTAYGAINGPTPHAASR